jgi:hypothetical protein
MQREKSGVCDARIAEMETQVGMIAHTQCYQEGFELPQDEQPSLQQLADTFVPAKSSLSSQRLNIKSSHDDIAIKNKL